MLQMYNVVIHNFKGYTPLIVFKNIGYIPHVVPYIPVAYFIHDCLYLLIPYPWIVPPLFPLLIGNN